MSLVGVELAFFLPVALLAYWAVPRRAVWQNVVLLVASYLFYAAWNPPYVLIRLRQGFVAVNFSVPDETRALYEQIARQWPERAAAAR